MFTVDEVKNQIDRLNKERVIKDLGVTFSYRDTLNVSYKSVVSEETRKLNITNFMCEVFILSVGKFEYLIYRKANNLLSVNISNSKNKHKLDAIKDELIRRDFLVEDSFIIEGGMMKFKDHDTGKYNALMIEVYGDPESKSREYGYNNYSSKSSNNRFGGKLMLLHPNTDDTVAVVNEIMRYILTKDKKLQEEVMSRSLDINNFISILSKIDYIPTVKDMKRKDKRINKMKRKAKSKGKEKLYIDELYRTFLSDKVSSSFCKTSEVVTSNSGYYEFIKMARDRLNGVNVNTISIRDKKTGALDCLIVLDYNEELKAGVVKMIYFGHGVYIDPAVFKEILHRHLREYYHRNFKIEGREYNGDGDCFYIERSKADPNVDYYKKMGAELVDELIEGSEIERYLIDGKGKRMRAETKYNQPMLTKEEYNDVLRKAKGDKLVPVISYKSAGMELWKVKF